MIIHKSTGFCKRATKKFILTLQIYADVCNREIKLAASDQSGAIGNAILGLMAAGPRRSGYNDVCQAAIAIGKISSVSYKPYERT